MLLLTVLVSAFLSALSFNLEGYSLLIWVSLSVLFLRIKDLSYQKIFFVLYLYGFLCSLFTFYWVSYVTVLGMFFLCLYLALYWAVFGLFFRWITHSKFSKVFLCGLVWIVLEYIKERLWGGFGWDLLGYTQAENILLIQICSVFGVKFISGLIICSNIFLSRIFLNKNKFPRREFLIFLLVLTFMVSYGYFKLKDKDYTEDDLSVSLVQPNIPLFWKKSPVYLDKIDTVYDSLLKGVSTDVVIFPEAGYPYLVDDEDNLNFIRDINKPIKSFSLWGAVIRENRKYYNSVLLFSDKGSVENVYRKIKLVPFGEFVPFRGVLSFIDVLNEIEDMYPGDKYELFSVKKAKIAVLICFEDVFSDFTRNFASLGANIIVNVTDDSWFKGYPQSLQHLRIAKFRAVENNRFVLRAANSGISCVISNFGQVIKKISEGKKDVFISGRLDMSIPMISKNTFYSRQGDIWILLLGLVFLILRFLNRIDK